MAAFRMVTEERYWVYICL